jgi:hydroxyacylglutathione hydrolase
MQLKQIFMENSLLNYNYFVWSEVNKKCVFFDPFDIEKTLPLAIERGLDVSVLLNTHHHYDHIKDNEKLLKRTGASLIELADGESFELSDTETITARYTPGHIDPHYCYFLSSDNKDWGVICGDLIFNGGVGNTKNGGDIEILASTILDDVLNWDESLKIYPSHDYMMTNLNFAKTVEPNNPHISKWIERKESTGRYLVTTLKDEKEFNPFFRVKSKEEFISLRLKRDKW